ncbi:Nucleotidyl transferase [Candidatus Koribacter versatilis Ellin345]|uniref:glucose-1-phosphate thymidylyltransferase n=1 Tax=Koribacter versatilis (strain Ellin345) TaxID=204669 RepID=Q1IUZ0_KORVE|nr:sugar phosphate nucleotidyltransferase [Candidatus Koribacter versatilis]ABF39310.1 Nucleotidyl transferase [Candidatus Koribacter versatilis Ellin345]
MIGIIPAAGAGQRIQPLGCSKELLPVGSRMIDGVERPKAVAEYLVERMIAAGAEQICMVISAEKSDIVRYFAERNYAAEIFYVVQQKPAGLCDALFRAEPFARTHRNVLIGLPDTIWFPENAYRPAVEDQKADVNLVLFPVDDPTVFDAVVCDAQNFVEKVEVKQKDAHSQWVWGAVTCTGESFHALKLLWESRHREDEYLGHLLNAYIAAGDAVRATHCGELYMDVGTLDGYHRALDYLRAKRQARVEPAA